MQRPSPGEYDPYFLRYISLVPDGDFLTLLRANGDEAARFFASVPDGKHLFSYAPGKWHIKQVLQHIIDTERVMAYRALVAARGDNSSVLPAMDENSFAENADTTNRTLPDLISEFAAVRTATIKLFEHITPAQSQLLARGATHAVSARALGYIIAGHVLHHIKITTERYL